jgi:hypothetical protein
VVYRQCHALAKRGGIYRDRRVIRRIGHSRVPMRIVAKLLAGVEARNPSPLSLMGSSRPSGARRHAQVRKFPANGAPHLGRSRPELLVVVRVLRIFALLCGRYGNMHKSRDCRTSSSPSHGRRWQLDSSANYGIPALRSSCST